MTESTAASAQPGHPDAEPVLIRYRGQTAPIAAGGRLYDAIRAYGLHPELTIAVINGTVERADVVLRVGDRVTLVPMMSGG